MAITEAAGAAVHWITRGDGHPLVLLHGLGGEIDFFTTEIDEFSRRYRVIAVDLRGSGGTRATGNHTMADLADDVRAVLDDAGVPRAHILGFSMGGNVAQAVAARYPERLDKLVLAATFATMNLRTRLFLDAVQRAYVAAGSQRLLFDLVCPWLFSPAFIADPDNRAHLTYPDGDADEQSIEAWVAQYTAQRTFDGRPELVNISAPTLVIGGTDDALVSVGDLETLAAGIRRSQLNLVAGAGHLLNLERPRTYLDAIGQFLG